MSKKALLPLLSVLAILAYGIVVEQVWSWSVLFDHWQSVGWSILGFSVVLMLLTHLIRGFRFYHFFLQDMPDRGLGTFLRLFSVSQTHNFLNSLLPFRSGEVSFPVLMKTEFALPMSRTAAGLLWMRMLDLHALGVFALVVVLYRFFGSSIMLWLLILLALLIPWLVFELAQPIRRFLERAQQEAYSGLAEKLTHFAWQCAQGMPNSRGVFFSTWCLTALNWAIKFFAMALVLVLLMGPPYEAFNFVFALAGSVGGELSAILPIHAPAGVGTYPAGVFLGMQWLSPELGGAELNHRLAQLGVSLHVMIMLSAVLGVVLAQLLTVLYSLRYQAAKSKNH